MTWLWLAALFAVFVLAIRLVYGLNRHGAAVYGYEPFSLPNAALMLIPNLLLLSALSDHGITAGADAVKLGIAAVLSAGMLVLVALRTRFWIACCAVALLAVGAIAILPSLVFRYFALADGRPGDG